MCYEEPTAVTWKLHGAQKFDTDALSASTVPHTRDDTFTVWCFILQ